VAAGDTLRLCETALASRLGETGISWAGVVIFALQVLAIFDFEDGGWGWMKIGMTLLNVQRVRMRM
jgi:hypothetical protein